MTEDGKKYSLEPVLEAPPPPESPVTSIGTLFADDSIALTTAKFNVVESYLTLLARPCRFPEFMREILLAMMRVLKSEAGSLLEVEHRSNTLFFRSVVGSSSDQVQKFKIPMGQGIAGHV